MLIQCPFCNETPSLSSRSENFGHGECPTAHLVKCNCGASSQSFAEGYDGSERECKQKAQHAWNKRVQCQVVPDADAKCIDGFDEAVVGVAVLFGRKVLIYSSDKCISLLESHGMDRDTAEEHFEFNVIGSCGPIQEGFPLFVDEEPVVGPVTH